MKTINYIAARLLTAVIAIAISASFASCQSDEEVYMAPTSNATVTDAHVTFTYTIPEELFKYAEITVCYNNNEGTDARWEPMLDNTFTVTYDLAKFPVMAPVVLVYDTTNRSGYGKSVDWDLTMDVVATMTIDGKREVRTHSSTYTICGDLGAGIDALMKNVLDRTYGIKINKAGDVEWIN